MYLISKGYSIPHMMEQRNEKILTYCNDKLYIIYWSVILEKGWALKLCTFRMAGHSNIIHIYDINIAHVVWCLLLFKNIVCGALIMSILLISTLQESLHWRANNSSPNLSNIVLILFFSYLHHDYLRDLARICSVRARTCLALNNWRQSARCNVYDSMVAYHSYTEIQMFHCYLQKLM